MRWSPLIVGSVLLGSLIAVSSAHADWQYTRWGMNPAEVVKASGGRASPNASSGQNTDDEIAKLSAPYAAGEFAFDAYFMFNRNTDRLSGVRLKLSIPSKCTALYSELMAKYGKPVSENNSRLAQGAAWQDRGNNLQVSILQIGRDSCSVAYAPISSAANKGL